MAILAALFKHVPTVGLPQNFAQKYVLKYVQKFYENRQIQLKKVVRSRKHLFRRKLSL